ncbi:MAG: hypothetical protein JJ908_02185 [Rhizobiales bacterium]|nr:hypothetical protein [Hyphomicrobiales bacterium]MBO6698588.1 hypothetical protein [Hyphomicrobiales bacterium]MBO6735159.1 hypothetical protein [Hyphomicrobiales bacterium]MBO6911034.1 hypothetical protein [Hyphomicrobiales bacterium]MBO6956455.1 hypothetical protein [Hyphomicrobiales bacterium]
MSGSAANVKALKGRIGITNAKARMPFRFGAVTIEAIASSTLALEMLVDGQVVTGYASELLAYKWFDKRPEKTPRDNIHDLLDTLNAAVDAATQLGNGTIFDHWRALDKAVHAHALSVGFNDLGASFGVAMVERAMMDGVARAHGLTTFDLLRGSSLGFQPAAIFPELGSMTVADAMPTAPLDEVALRHTVGMVDPITAADLDPDNRPSDGLPETLEDYLAHDQLSYLKIKLGGDVDADCARLEQIGAVMANTGRRIAFTLDGNEQFQSLADFADFTSRLRSSSVVSKMLDDALFIEQPLDRRTTFENPPDQAAFDAIGVPLLIDEADGKTTAFHEAITLGYRGVSHKNCKGVFRSLLNAMLAEHHNQAAGPGTYFQSAEDLTCMPVLSINADLALIAALGIAHGERNAHHYFAGLSHLTEREADTALEAHPDLYQRDGEAVRLRTQSGALSAHTANGPGFGTMCVPDINAMTPADAWDFNSLGLSEAGS